MGFSQARILEWVSICFSRKSSRPKDQAWVSCIAGGIFTTEPVVVTLVNLFVQTKNKYCFHFLFNKWFSLFKLPLFCKLRLLLFSLSVMSSSLQLHGLQHTKPPCPLPSPEVCPSSCPLHQWCHLAISSSDKLFFCPQSFPALGTFPMSWLFTSSDQNTGASLPSKEYSGLISLKIDCFDLLMSKWISGVFFSTTVWRKQFFGSLTSFWSRFHNRTWPLVRP